MVSLLPLVALLATLLPTLIAQPVRVATQGAAFGGIAVAGPAAFPASNGYYPPYPQTPASQRDPLGYADYYGGVAPRASPAPALSSTSATSQYHEPFRGEGYGYQGGADYGQNGVPNYSGSPGTGERGGNAYLNEHFSPWQGDSDPWADGFTEWGRYGPFNGRDTTLPYYGSGPLARGTGRGSAMTHPASDFCSSGVYFCDLWYDPEPICSNGVTFRSRCEAKCNGVVGYESIRAGVCGQTQGAQVAQTEYYYNPGVIGQKWKGSKQTVGANVWQMEWDPQGVFGAYFNPLSPSSFGDDWYNGGLFSPRAPYDIGFGPFW